MKRSAPKTEPLVAEEVIGPPLYPELYSYTKSIEIDGIVYKWRGEWWAVLQSEQHGTLPSTTLRCLGGVLFKVDNQHVSQEFMFSQPIYTTNWIPAETPVNSAWIKKFHNLLFSRL